MSARSRRCSAQAIGTFGTIDVLVNNAGLQSDAPFEELTLAQWNKVIGVNLTGQFLCAREAVREFKRRGIRPEVSCAAGKILCISSVHEVIPWAGHVNYAASKGGVMLMMKSLAQEVAPYRIRVNSICPGAIRTPINMEAWGTMEAYQELLKLIPYKRIGEPEEIGRAAVWLASDYADYVHGISLFVDGGMSPVSRDSRPGDDDGGAEHPWGLCAALREHWPEYLIEAWALGTFMISAGAFSTLLGYPGSPMVRPCTARICGAR